jgi:hypothetical protein
MGSEFVQSVVPNKSINKYRLLIADTRIVSDDALVMIGTAAYNTGPFSLLIRRVPRNKYKYKYKYILGHRGQVGG